MSEIGYKAALTKNFLKQLRKLPEDIRARVLKAAGAGFPQRALHEIIKSEVLCMSVKDT
jgi:mRNA-degrading endonuclease RelE of RelBE toxin-antitoxin system